VSAAVSSLDCSLALQLFIQKLNGFAVYVALVGAEASREAFWDVKKLVNQRFFFFLLGQWVVVFRDNLNDIGRGTTKCLLPYSTQAVYTSENSTRLGAFASYAVDELGNHVEQSQDFSDAVNLFFDVSCLEILYRHGLCTFLSRMFCIL
jgi:hypothetical protein